MRRVFFCDSTLIALLITQIPSLDQAEIIFERKECDKASDHVEVMRAILSDIRFVSSDCIDVPDPFFIANRRRPVQSYFRMRKFYKNIKKKYFYHPDTLFYGATTSSLFKCAPIHQRRYLDHGFIEPYRRMSRRTETSLPDIILRYIAKFYPDILNIPPIDPWCGRLGYSGTNVRGDSFTFVDLTSYSVPKRLRDILCKITPHNTSTGSKVLVLLSSPWPSECGYPKNNSIFDDLNFELIKDNCSKDELILLKFHRTAYKHPLAKSSFLSRLRSCGFNVTDVDENIPLGWRGQIPAEIFIKVMKVNRVVTEVSATLCHISHLTSVESVSDLGPFWHLRNPNDREIIGIFIRLNHLLHNSFTVRNSENLPIAYWSGPRNSTV